MHPVDIPHTAGYITLEVIQGILVDAKSAIGKHITRPHQHAQSLFVRHLLYHPLGEGAVIGVILDLFLGRGARGTIVIATLRP